MEAHLPDANAVVPDSDSPTPPPADPRATAQQFLDAQRERLDQIEASLAEHLQSLTTEFSRGQLDAQQERDELERKRQALQQHGQELSQLKHHLEQQQAHWGAMQEQAHREREAQAELLRQESAELEARREQLIATEARLREEQRQFHTQRDELEAGSEQLARRRQRIDEIEKKLESQREELENQQAETRAQRRRIAAELKTQRAELAAQLARRQSELDQQQSEKQAELERTVAELLIQVAQLQTVAEDASVSAAAAVNETYEQELAHLRGERDALTARLTESESRAAGVAAELSSLTTKLADAESRAIQAPSAEELTRLHAEMDALQARLTDAESNSTKVAAQRDSLAAELAAAAGGAKEAAAKHDALAAQLAETETRLSQAPREDETIQLREERDALVERLAVAEKQAAQAAASVEDGRTSDLQRRFELAVEDVRDLKRRNAEMEEKLAAAQTAGGGDSGGLDWESCKKRLLSSLEADSSYTADERLTIEGTIRITDDVVSGKDQELKQLKRQLAELESSHLDEAEPIAAVEQDEQIKAEREKLAKMQEEWSQKLRQAEIDISIERAKIARERADIEGKLRNYQAELDNRADEKEADEHPKREPKRGRWLARLGLNDPEKEGK